MTNVKEKRQHKRFDTEVKVYFHFEYDVKTKVEYQKADTGGKVTPQKFPAVSRNVSSAGMCIVCDHLLQLGDHLFLDVYVPGSQEPIPMEGDVKWSKKLEQAIEGKYSAGIQLTKVMGEDVQASIHYDDAYKVEWSAVLEAVLGSYRVIAQKRKV